MRKPDTIIIDGRAHSWRRILDLRRARIEAWKATRPKQRALFELKEDRRPATEQTAPARYCEPTLMTLINEAVD